MSSTNRGKERHISDHYITPKPPIRKFLDEFLRIEKDQSNLLFDDDMCIYDPCAGGNEKYGMPYPEVLKDLGFRNIGTNDIRDDSPARLHCDYLSMELINLQEMIITNPPFSLAIPIIKKALTEVIVGGYVIKLLRLNFFGSEDRKSFFKEFMPKYCFVHANRISFFPEDIPWPTVDKDGKDLLKLYKKGSTDSIEYAHYVWQVGHHPEFCKLKVI